MRLHLDRAQSASEYSIFLAIALIIIIAMNVYVKRGLQGRYVDVADFTTATLRRKVAAIDPQIEVYDQYEPYYAYSVSNTAASRQVEEKTTVGSINKALVATGTSQASLAMR